MITPKTLVAHVSEKLTTIEAHLKSFPPTRDQYFGIVMVRTCRSVLHDHESLYSNPYGARYYALQELYNTLASGEYEDQTTLNWTSRRQFFIFLKIVAAKILQLISNERGGYQAFLSVCRKLPRKEREVCYAKLMYDNTQFFKEKASSPHSSILFLEWVCEELCSMSFEEGVSAARRNLPLYFKRT